jgi:hypothetical protein
MRVPRRLLLGCLAGALFATRARAQAPVEGGGPALTPDGGGGAVATKQSARDRLDEAVRRYQFGERDAAQGLLAALVIAADVPGDVRQEARVYLGELLFIADDKESASRFFEQVLAAEPDYVIDPFLHPPDVVGFFNYVRAFREPVGPAEGTGPALPPGPLVATIVPPAPPSAMVGLGIYQLRQGKTGSGLAFLGTQAAALTANVIAHSVYWPNRRYPEGDVDELARLQRLRVTSFVASGVLLISWPWNVSASTRHWRRVEGPRRAEAQAAQAGR